MLRIVAGISLTMAVAMVSRLQSAPSAAPAPDRWKLEWDDRVDGVIEEGPKVCEVTLHFGHAKVEGEFSGPVEGKNRSANFVGEVLQGKDARLLLLRQTEESYVCAYQCQIQKDGSYVGVWHDTMNRSGDVRFTKEAVAAK
jgi:hypothetical protein